MFVSQIVPHNDELNPALFETVCSMLGSSWRKLGNHINLDEDDLNHIDLDYRDRPNAAHEQAMQVLLNWKRKTGNENWRDLKDILSSFQRNDIVGEVESKFQFV